MFFRKKVIQSTAQGRLLKIESVPDQVFSEKLMGEGFAIDQHNGQIHSPINGRITSIFPTKHALTLVNEKDGFEVLLHLGIDTVELKGKPFELSINEGEEVKAGQLIGKMSVSEIQEAGLNPMIITVFTNPAHPVTLTDSLYETEVSAGQEIGKYK